MLGTISILLCVVIPVQGYSGGPPSDVCITMMPGHSQAPQSSTSAYSITFSKNTYAPNEEIEVTLSGSTFKGFLIQPRLSGGAAGTYGSIASFPANTRNPCNNGVVAICHSTNTSKSSTTFTWTAPDSDVGSIVFVYTVVESFPKYWVKLQSDPLTFQASNPLVTTTPVVTNQPATTTTQALTTLSIDNSRPTAINRDSACGVTKSCFPADCGAGCDYLVMWENVDQETTKFTMQKKTTSPNYYIAIGLSDDPSMGNDSVTLCISQDGVALVQSAFNLESPNKFNQLLENSVFGVDLLDSFHANGILSCTFNRKKTADYANAAISGRKKRATDTDNFFDLESDWFLFVAHGKANQGTVTMHSTRPVISDGKIDFQAVYGSDSGTTMNPTVETSVIKKDRRCGSEYGCFHDCNRGDCKFLFTWNDDGGDEVMFTCNCVQGRNRYCALGLSSDDKMGDDSVIACGPSGGNTEVKNFYNDGQSCRPTNNPMLGIRMISSSNVNGVLSASFAKKKTVPGDSQIFDLNQDWTLLYAEGPYLSGFVSKHSARPQISSRKADFQKAMDIGAEKSSVDLVYLHATFMVTAWMFFASFGIFTARYFKGVWPDEAKLCGEKRWFTIHRTCMMMVFLFTAAGFVVIFVHVEGYSDIEGSNWNKSHPIIGIVVMALALLNPTIALFRPHPGTKFRPVFNFFHSIFGGGGYALSIVNVFSGTWLATTNVPSYIRIVLYVFVGWIVVMEIIFVYLTHIRKQERSQDYYEMAAKGSSSDPQESRTGSGGGKSAFLVLYGLVLLGFAAAVAIIVWTQRENE